LKLGSSGAGAGGAAGPTAASLGDFDVIVNGPFKTFMELSKRIGSEVATMGDMVEAAFMAHRGYLEIATKAKKPSDGELPMLQKPMADKMVEIENFREKGRRCDYFNHLSAISESIPALGWINMAPTPAPFVKEMCDASMFYTNRVLKDWKDKSKAHVDWTKAWIQTLTQLQGFVKQHHTTGLVWNPKGVEAKSVVNHVFAKLGVPPAPAGPAAGGPPPPPPIPKNLFDDIKVAENKEEKARNALFDDLNKGDGVTSGLKKVTADMQTHKNPGLRGTSVVPAGAIKSSSPKPGAFKAATPPKKEPKFELEGKKWAVEYHVKNPNLVIEETETNQSVYVYRCEGSTLKVEGKVNNIVVDGCKKCAVVFTDAVSSCEFINCQSVQMQVMGKVPTISIDKTDGCQMFLSKDSVGVEIITAKSSEMNVMIPNGEDFVEQPIPEQFKTVINGIKLSTTHTEST